MQASLSSAESDKSFWLSILRVPLLSQVCAQNPLTVDGMDVDVKRVSGNCKILRTLQNSIISAYPQSSE
jgi:hypothetical protein